MSARRRRAALSTVAAAMLIAVGADQAPAALRVVPVEDGLMVRGDDDRDRLDVDFPAADAVVLSSPDGLPLVAASLTAGTVPIRCTESAGAVRCDATGTLWGMRLRVSTGRGNDRVRFMRPSTARGGIVAPVVNGGPGRDLLVADGEIVGGPGDDVVRVVAGRVASALIGGPGNDVLRGAGGDDVLIGGRGRDRMVDLGGVNRFVGGPGRDIAVVARRLTSGSTTTLSLTPSRGNRLDTIAWDVERVQAAPTIGTSSRRPRRAGTAAGSSTAAHVPRAHESR